MNQIFPSPLRLPVSLLLGLTLALAGWELAGQLPVARWLATLLSPDLTDARQAVAEFHAAVHQSDMEWVLFFCSSEYDLDALAAEMRGQFDGVQVVVSALYPETAPC